MKTAVETQTAAPMLFLQTTTVLCPLAECSRYTSHSVMQNVEQICVQVEFNKIKFLLLQGHS